MQFQAIAGAAEAVGQNDVGARLDEGARKFGDALGMRGIPKLRRIAPLQSAIEQVAARRAVGQEPGPFGQQRSQLIAMTLVRRTGSAE